MQTSPINSGYGHVCLQEMQTILYAKYISCENMQKKKHESVELFGCLTASSTAKACEIAGGNAK
jgi:hypothetical protein